MVLFGALNDDITLLLRGAVWLVMQRNLPGLLGKRGIEVRRNSAERSGMNRLLLLEAITHLNGSSIPPLMI